jgi:SAM-dependent methyltransferase
MKKNKEVSKFDKIAYKQIRDNVSSFIKTSALKYDKKNKIILDIAPQIYNDAEKYFQKSRMEILDIEKGDNINYQADITNNNKDTIRGGRFDLIICTEVLEHVANPFLAINEIFRLLKKGGILLLSTPFNFRIHGPLPDCWRFTEHGLKILLTDFKIIKLNAMETKDRFLMPVHYTIIAKKIK